MRIVVLLRMVPDVVEDLQVSSDGTRLEEDTLRMILSESDDHALEEALLLKERYGGTVTAVAPEAPELDEALFAALAKGADRVVKISGADVALSVAEQARLLARALKTTPGLLPADLILTGVQSPADLDGLVAPLVAHELGLAHMGIVTEVRCDEPDAATIRREFTDGVRADFKVRLPAVLGIQSAEHAPRYVPVAKIRAAMKTQKIEASGALVAADGGAALVEVKGLEKPQAAGHAEMLEGDSVEVARRLCDIFASRDLV